MEGVTKVRRPEYWADDEVWGAYMAWVYSQPYLPPKTPRPSTFHLFLQSLMGKKLHCEYVQAYIDAGYDPLVALDLYNRDCETLCKRDGEIGW